jgi:YidC/Oxa1 family membrane protein insertase
MWLFSAFSSALYHVLETYQSLLAPVAGAHSYWLAIVLLTVTVRALLLPLVLRQQRAAEAMRALGVDVEAIKARHAGDSAAAGRALAELYRERGAGLLGGCLPLLVQAPFMYALIDVVRAPSFGGRVNLLLGHSFLGVALDARWTALAGWGAKLASPAGLTILALVALMILATWLGLRANAAPAAPATPRALQLLPLALPLGALGFPLAAVVYWTASSLWSAGQQLVLARRRPVP